ncbi:LOW QUALITY PROTEIN: corrinoid adenosyltransferase MMAB-like [Uloborus diversus]|uniref:LOW QUALITY PROTEIN: corrinoid adenosyltransferase MMAB-like n=1 Tax=Uloborus diversus TaxID=327109 RepID=UPI002409A5AF|nr:LOW QUALITY PROTEIN: corrinoid adenosyltransferase MMAB-like [Uloborus diversus]
MLPIPRLLVCSTAKLVNVSSKYCFQFSTSSCMRFPKIYTRTGDKGKSSTFTLERRYKDDMIFEALGSTDELTSAIGFAREFLPESCEHIDKQLQEVQCIIQDLAAAVATPKSSSKQRHIEKTKFTGNHVETLEIWIDEHTKNLPPLNNFILPSGGPGSAALHLARAICRRAERRVVPLVKDDEVDEAPMQYLNRLSDYLFTIARVVGLAAGREEFIYWQPKPRSKK